jgi:hypothetical protein
LLLFPNESAGMGAGCSQSAAQYCVSGYEPESRPVLPEYRFWQGRFLYGAKGELVADGRLLCVDLRSFPCRGNQ